MSFQEYLRTLPIFYLCTLARASNNMPQAKETLGYILDALYDLCGEEAWMEFVDELEKGNGSE
jgi:hypothetical protein